MPTVADILGDEGGSRPGEGGPSTLLPIVDCGDTGDDGAGCWDGTSASSFSAVVLVSESGPPGVPGIELVETLGLASALLSLDPGILFLMEPRKDLVDSRVSALLKDG